MPAEIGSQSRSNMNELILKNYFNLNQNGNTLVTVLAAAAIGLIVSFAILSLNENNLKTQKGIQQKTDANELQRILSTTTSGINICQYSININQSRFSFSSSGFPSAVTSPIDLDTIATDASGANILAQKEFRLPGSTLLVDSITLTELTGAPPTLTAKLNVNFRDTAIPMKPISILAAVSSVVSGANAQITGCKIDASTGTGGNRTDPGANFSRDSCISAGFQWVTPPSPRPAFCTVDNESIVWY